MSDPIKHIWEIDHPYYAAEGYRSDYKSWQDYIEEWSLYDDDLNMVYRWDVEKEFDDDLNQVPIKCTDPNYRAYRLAITRILQRKSTFNTSIIEFCQNDEPAIIEHLKQKWDYMKTLWEGIS